MSLGFVLDDEEIVDILRKSKMTSNEISKRIKATRKAESEIEETRKLYLPIGTRGALLYFLVSKSTSLYSHSINFWEFDIETPTKNLNLST